MFIDKNSIIIDGINMGQYITQAKYEYHKLWASDSGRNLAGVQTGTLIGVFPKIILSFRKLTKSELENLTSIFDSARQNFTYYDPNKKANITMQTYTGDYEILNKNITTDNMPNETFDLSFIAIRKRT